MTPGTGSATTDAVPPPARPLPSTTAALIALNVLVFLIMALSSGHFSRFDSSLVLRWGGNYGPLTLGGQPWRLVTAIMVHVGFAHLLINIWCLYELGLMVEHIYGAVSLVTLYALAGVAGSLGSLVRSPTIVSAGASGAIFGLAGVLISTLLRRRLIAPRRELVVAVASLLAFAAYNLSYGFLKGGIDNGAHVGGLVCGLVMGIAIAGTTAHRRVSEELVYALALGALVAGYVVVKKERGDIVAVEAARVALTQGDPDGAIRRLTGSPAAAGSSAGLTILAAAYIEKTQFAEAENYYRRALEINPRDAAAHAGLAIALSNSGRLPEAARELQTAAPLNPTGDIWLQLGTVLQQLGQHAEAVRALRQAASLDANRPQVQFALGISEMNLRHYDAATAAFQKCTQLAPNDYVAQIWLANAYQAAGKSNDAAAAYMRAAQLHRTTAPPRGQGSKP